MDPIIGTIIMWPCARIPQGWALCNGQPLAINTNQVLYSLIGTIYGGDNVNFNLPNLVGRMPIGVNPTANANQAVHMLGTSGGTETHTIATANLPAHTHVATFSPTTAGVVATKTLGTTTTPAAGMIPAQINGTAVSNAIGTPANIFAYGAPDANTVVMSGALSLNGAVTNGITGTGIPLNTMPPFQTVNYIICTDGLYPNFP